MSPLSKNRKQSMSPNLIRFKTTKFSNLAKNKSLQDTSQRDQFKVRQLFIEMFVLAKFDKITH